MSFASFQCMKFTLPLLRSFSHMLVRTNRTHFSVSSVRVQITLCSLSPKRKNKLVNSPVSMTTAQKLRAEKHGNTQLCLVDPELAAFLYIICLYHSRRACKQLVNKVTESRFSTTVSFNMFTSTFTTGDTLSSETREPLSLKRAGPPKTGWPEVVEHQSSPTAVLRAALQTALVRLFWCTSERDCCVHAQITHAQSSFGLT